MIEKFFYIEPEMARNLLTQIDGMRCDKRGVDRKAYLFDEYAVLSASRIKIRNGVRDDNLAYFDELIHILWQLSEQGVNVVPIYGYCFDPQSTDGTGYIFQKRAKGEELYDDAIMKAYYVWGDKLNYLSSDMDPKEYILSRTALISRVPQGHFDKFISDIVTIANQDIMIDCMGKSNFFYHEEVGFQFIDIDSFTDIKYGLTNERLDSGMIAAMIGLIPCHPSVGTELFAIQALAEDKISGFCNNELQQLAEDNAVIYEKCKTALRNNGILSEPPARFQAYQFTKKLDL